MNTTFEVNIKIVIVGHERSGKTSLVRKLTENTFSALYNATIGCALSRAEIFPENERRKIVLTIWDASGAERYRSFTSKFIKCADIAIICYDVQDSESWQAARKYIHELRKTKKNNGFLVYLCATKIDTIPASSKISTQMEVMKRYSSSNNVDRLFEISCKDRKAVVSMFHMIARRYCEVHKERLEEEENEIIHCQAKAKEKKVRSCFGFRLKCECVKGNNN